MRVFKWFTVGAPLKALKRLTFTAVMSNIAPAESKLSLRKEVIQPQVPLRLPCYDLVPVIELTVGRRLSKVSNPTSGTPDSHHLTGGVYKAQEHIHRVIADTRLLAIPTSCRRVASLQSELGRLFCDLLHLTVLRRSVVVIVARVKPWA